MALEIRKAEVAPVGIIADRRLYLTADRSKMVEDGDTSAAFLFATPGTVIPSSDVQALGLELVDGKVQQRSAAASDQDPPDASLPKVLPADKPKGKK